MIEVHWSIGAFILLSHIGLLIKSGLAKGLARFIDKICRAVARNMFRTLYVRMQSSSKPRPVSEIPYFLRGKPASMHLGSYIQMQKENAAKTKKQ
ncbi:hypothetical protein [Thaumasiovibrio sp. DFM-14]|uniref:hypothetical protein n=1 Tax=Thaumasiovibrio sp. DFM-14 TaxID=3384792 RepID=UPI0039A3A51D